MDQLQFRYLSAAYSEDLLKNFYYRIFVPAFPLFDEREDFELWSSLLREKSSPPLSEIVLSGYRLGEADPVIVGGQGVEYYPESQCGLLTYLVIAPEFRGRGMAKPLVKAGLEAIECLAGGNKVRAYFSETNDPSNPQSFNDPQNPRERVAMLDKLGFYLVDFPYVQPRLKGRGDRYYGLKLMAHLKTWGYDHNWTQAPARLELESSILANYLQEFYRVTEGEFDSTDRDMKRMTDFLYQHPRLNCRPLRELLA